MVDPALRNAPGLHELDPVATAIQAAVANLIAGRPGDAEEWLEWRPEHSGLTAGGRGLSAKEQLRVFRRDRFTCRYCGKRTIFIPVLRILSSLYPDKVPFHPHWRWNATHPAYWTHGASCDHLVPVSRGGGSVHANLITACYQCNSIKQHWLLEELRWNLLPPSEDPEWDGLSGSYLALCELTSASHQQYHFSWTRAIREEKRR
jgi:5-methylcytosine-specific restriction endonuclease McrA